MSPRGLTQAKLFNPGDCWCHAIREWILGNISLCFHSAYCIRGTKLPEIWRRPDLKLRHGSPSAKGANSTQPWATPRVEVINPIPSPVRAFQAMPQSLPQSLARLHVHLIFSSKHREPLIHDTVHNPPFSNLPSPSQNGFGGCQK